MQKSRNRIPLVVLVSAQVMALAVTLGGQTPDVGRRTSDSSAFYRALELEGAGKFREAAPLFRRALRSSSGVSALLGLERVFAELHSTDSLLAPLDTLIRENPREPVYRTVQLRSLESLGRPAEVQLAFERWAAANPRDVTPYREYARLLLQRGAAPHADSVLALAAQRLGRTDDLQYETAQAQAAMGHWEASARAWRVALGAMPYLEQAAAYALAPAPVPVRDSIRNQFFASPVLIGARRALATLEAAWGTPANGWLALRDLEPDSASANAWLEFATRAEMDERWTQAREALASVLRWRASPDVALRAAIAALNSGDPAAAMVLAPLSGAGLDSARLARTVLPVHVRALAQLGKPATAERLVASFQPWLTPSTQAGLARSIAFGWVRVGDMARARGALAVAGVEGDSSDASGWLALYSGDLRSARRLLRGSGDASPELALVLGLLARIPLDSAPALGHAFLTLARGDTTRAAAAMLESAERLPEAASLLLYTAAQLRRAQGDDAQATSLWRRVVEQYASSAEAPAAELDWARAARRAGDLATASQRLEHLILTYPQSALVPQARRDLELVRNNIPGIP